MIRIISQTEEVPEKYPEVHGVGYTETVPLWQRLEHYLAYRWPARSVTWIAEGSGEFRPPLAHAEDITVSEPAGPDWQEVDAIQTPLGIVLRGGLYQIKARVGEDEPPAAVCEAVRRLGEYMQDLADHPTLGGRYSESLGDASISINGLDRAAAQALTRSGAADLLRPWRFV